MPFSPVVLRKDSSAETLKNALLYIIAAYRFAQKFCRERSFNQLSLGMADYAKQPGVKKRGTGGITYVSDQLDAIDKGIFKLDELVRYYNQIKEPVTPAMHQEIAGYLGATISADDKTPEKQAARQQTYLDRINALQYCQFLFEEKFPAIQEMTWSFISEAQPDSPSVPDFVKSSNRLSDVYINLVGDPKLPHPTSDLPPPPRPGTEPTASIDTGPSTELKPPQYYIAHYLNLKRQPALALVTLYWQADELVKVTMEQYEGFLGGSLALSFENLDKGIVDGGQTVYVVMQECHPPANRSAFQMQVTIEKAMVDGQRNGLFSSIIYSGKRPSQVAGTVVLQQIPEVMSVHALGRFSHTLAQPVEGSDPARLTPDQKQLLTAQMIRYELLGQFVNTQLVSNAQTKTPWSRLQRYVGHYTCYYLRLAKLRLETSHIHILPDGTATLEQPQDGTNKPIHGYVRMAGNRLWMYFGYNADIGHEPIRFSLDDANASYGANPDSEPQLRGIFSSETKIGNWLVSGRMLMKKLPPHELQKMVSQYYKDVTLADFEGRAEDLDFFTKRFASETIRTDGPFWAEIARRIGKHSAIKKLEDICTSKTASGKPVGKLFNNNRFYYYTFKAGGNDEDQFQVERNLVTFYPNGTVEIVASDVCYKGYTYHLKNTLRLSLSDDKHGFLEVFLELGDDIYDLDKIKMLYGMSLWHSTQRLQGKTVVLSRYEADPLQPGATLNPKTEFFQFYDSTDKHFAEADERLKAEDGRSGGVLSYLRGVINRYMHATTRSLPVLIRPRDKQFREMHFLIACFYGGQLRKGSPKASLFMSEKELMENCRKHLRAAYTHGYACSFANLSIDPAQALQSDEYIRDVYQARFPETKGFDGKRFGEILLRIKQIAKEQLFLQQAFEPSGPLGGSKQLLAYALPFWREWLEPVAAKNNSQALTIPFTTDPSDPH